MGAIKDTPVILRQVKPNLIGKKTENGHFSPLLH